MFYLKSQKKLIYKHQKGSTKMSAACVLFIMFFIKSHKRGNDMSAAGAFYDNATNTYFIGKANEM